MASGTIKSVVPRSDIVNNLTTNDSTKVLSAAQGKALYDKIVDYEMSACANQTAFDSAFSTLASSMSDKEQQSVKIQATNSYGQIKSGIYLGVVRKWSSSRIYVELTSANNSVVGLYLGSSWGWRSTDNRVDGMEIPSNADLDTYLTPGEYYAPTSAVASTLSHCPVEANFTMLVLRKASALFTQVLYSLGTLVYTRSQSTTGWSPWYSLNDKLSNLVGIYRYAINASSTKTITLGYSSRARIETFGNSGNMISELLVYTSGSGAIRSAVVKEGSDITYAISTGGIITITNANSGSNGDIIVTLYSGSVSD